MEDMNTETLIAEIQKLPADQKQVVRDFVLADEKDEIASTLKERAQGPFVPFDPEDEAFFNEVCEESEKMLQAEIV
ncbi:MAG: hypothetical protein ACI9DF_004118 [Verrucomicrobiales bacterium]|jgi:hypothetical protein